MNAVLDQASGDDNEDGGFFKPWMVAALLVLVLAALGWWAYSSMGSGPSGPKRQTVKIAVLPDTPPPPPPPKEEKKPEPEKQENKPQQQQDQPKPVQAPPEPQQLKMDGPAGDGPSAFAAGQVNSEYKGGAVGTGAGGTLGERMASNNFGNSARRELNEFLNRDQELRRGGDYKLPVSLWVRADGSIERFDLGGTSGNDEVDAKVRAALARFKGFRSPPPAGMAQPIRLQITNRMTG